MKSEVKNVFFRCPRPKWIFYKKLHEQNYVKDCELIEYRQHQPIERWTVCNELLSRLSTSRLAGFEISQFNFLLFLICLMGFSKFSVQFFNSSICSWIFKIFFVIPNLLLNKNISKFFFMIYLVSENPLNIRKMLFKNFHSI